MQEESEIGVVTPRCTRKKRRRGGLRFSTRRQILRSRMVRQQAPSVGVDLLGKVRTHSSADTTVTAPLRLENAPAESAFESAQQRSLLQLIEELHDLPTRSPGAGYKQTESTVRNCKCGIDIEIIRTIPIPRSALGVGALGTLTALGALTASGALGALGALTASGAS